MKRLLTAVALAGALVGLSGCGSSDAPRPSTAACGKALVHELRVSLATGQEGTQPRACVGLDDATVSNLAAKALTEVSSDE